VERTHGMLLDRGTGLDGRERIPAATESGVYTVSLTMGSIHSLLFVVAYDSNIPMSVTEGA